MTKGLNRTRQNLKAMKKEKNQLQVIKYNWLNLTRTLICKLHKLCHANHKNLLPSLTTPNMVYGNTNHQFHNKNVKQRNPTTLSGWFLIYTKLTSHSHRHHIHFKYYDLAKPHHSYLCYYAFATDKYKLIQRTCGYLCYESVSPLTDRSLK